MHRELVPYDDLNGRQQENFNYHKVSAALADYGYTTLRLTDDYNAGDFLAVHISGDVLSVQLKSRFTVARRYDGKGLYIAFPDRGDWFIGPHDDARRLLEEVQGHPTSFNSAGEWHQARLSAALRARLKDWCLSRDGLDE